MVNTLELWEIEAKTFNPEISLQEIKELWLRAKKIVGEIIQFSDGDVEVILGIFNNGIDRVGDFFTKWLDGKIQPTDEELDLLEEAFSEASWAFDFLSTNIPPDDKFSSEDNQLWQKKIKGNKQIVNKEKDKRKQIKDLQSQINSLQNQPNNSNNEARIRDLERQIDELKKNKPTSPNPQIPQNPTSSSSDNSLLIGIFCLGFGVCLVLLVGFLAFTKKNKK